MIFSHSSQGWNPRGEKSSSNPFSHQVLQVELSKLQQLLHSLSSYHSMTIANVVLELPF